MSNFEYVKTFMKTFGQKIETKPQFPNNETMQLRYDLIKEELDELEALAMEDEMNVEVSNAPIASQHHAQPNAMPAQAQAEDEEEKELNALAGMMA